MAGYLLYLSIGEVRRERERGGERERAERKSVGAAGWKFHNYSRPWVKPTRDHPQNK